MVTFENVLAIIPARKGSRRLPGKNKMRLQGCPLWKNTMWIARSAGIKNIVVSTNDQEIYSHTDTLPNNIMILQRPDELAKDDTTTDQVIQYVLCQFDLGFDIVCLMQPTSPLLDPTTLKHALHQFIDRNLTCLVAVNHHYKPCGAFYIFRKSSFIDNLTLWIRGLDVYIVSEMEAIDIDYIHDFRIAEALDQNRVIRLSGR